MATPRDWGSLFDLWRELSPSGSVLVLDEFPYLVRNAPELPSILQRTVDSLGDSGKKIVICGSSQRMMQRLVLDSSEPLYGRAKEILKIEPLGYEWMAKAFPKRTPFERFAYWAVFGGVPRYWELTAGDGDLMESIRQHVMSPLGVLHDEPSHLVIDEVSDFAKASSILSLVGNGVNRMSEIAARMGRKATEMSHPIKRLQELGLIERQIPFGADKANGKKSVYRIADNFLSFWYSFVAPNLSRPSFLDTPEGKSEFDVAFRIFLGQKWEKLVRLRVADDWNGVSRWWGTGLDRQPMELDIVAESRDGRTLLVGEAKLSLPLSENAHVLAELERKAQLLPFRAKYKTVVPRLFVADSELAEAKSIGEAQA